MIRLIMKLIMKLIERNYANTCWQNYDKVHTVTVKNLGLVSL